MSSENLQRHAEVQKRLSTTGDKKRQSTLHSYWSGFSGTDLEREHAREEAAIEKRLARMKSRAGGFALQAQ